MDISRLLRDSHIPAFNNTNLVFVGIISDREFLWKTRQVVSRQRQIASRLPGIDFQVSVCRPMSHWNFGGELPSLWGQITCFPTNSVTVTLKNVNEYTKTLRSYRAKFNKITYRSKRSQYILLINAVSVSLSIFNADLQKRRRRVFLV